jgi:hypothetical protein
MRERNRGPSPSRARVGSDPNDARGVGPQQIPYCMENAISRRPNFPIIFLKCNFTGSDHGNLGQPNNTVHLCQRRSGAFRMAAWGRRSRLSDGRAVGAGDGSSPTWRLPVNMDCQDAPTDVSGVYREGIRIVSGKAHLELRLPTAAMRQGLRITSPFFITDLTLRSSPMSVSGSPSTVMISANFPASIVPMRRCAKSEQQLLHVCAATSSGV